MKEEMPDAACVVPCRRHLDADISRNPQRRNLQSPGEGMIQGRKSGDAKSSPSIFFWVFWRHVI